MSYFLVFIAALSLGVMITIVFSTLYTGISPMPSSAAERKALLSLVEETPEQIVVLGSGWGGLAQACARTFPDANVLAYEYSIVPFWFSKYTSHQPKLSFIRDDFTRVHLPERALFVCYLYPKGMRMVDRLLKDKSGWLLSCVFAVHRTKPIRKIRVQNRHKSYVYLYPLGD